MRLRISLLALVTLAALAGAQDRRPNKGAPKPGPGAKKPAGPTVAAVLRHDIQLTLDPATGTFRSIDKMVVRGPGVLVARAWKGVQVTLPKAPLPTGDHEVEAVFEGKIVNPVKKARGATWVAGDSTAGTISPRGSYLVGGFYLPSAKPAKFRITIEVPKPHLAIAQGKRIAESDDGTTYRVTFEQTAPSDGMVVATGPWVKNEIEVDGTSCRTYLYEADRAHAKILLASLQAEIPRFQKIFGPVPDGRFDVVENFFATGYGFPNWTLLGESVIQYVCAKTQRAGGTRLPSGYIDHELVHAWLGNHLMVDYERGNWCEALTTYFANYGSAVDAGTAVDYRRKVARQFSLKVTAKTDYPLRQFRSKVHGYDNDIGYGKGSMVFKMLADEVGADRLEGAVRAIVEKDGGKALGWADMVAALGRELKRDLKPWFAPWLDQVGAPILQLGTLYADGNVLSGTIAQTQPDTVYSLWVPLRITTAKGAETHRVLVAARESAFRVTLAAPAMRVELDPKRQVFRKTPRERAAPCLHAVTTAEKRVGAGPDRVLRSLEVPSGPAAIASDAATLLIGVPAGLRSDVERGVRALRVNLKLEDKAFEFQGKRYDGPSDGILITYPRTSAPGLPVAAYHGNGEPAFARVHYLPYYASETWVIFRSGRPIARGIIEVDRTTDAKITKARQRKPDIGLDTLLMLTESKHRGRRADWPQAQKLANTLRGRVHQIGFEVLAWPAVNVPTGALDAKRSLTLGDEIFRGGIFPLHRSGAAASFAGVVTKSSNADVSGKLVLAPESIQDDEIAALVKNGAAGVAILASTNDMKARGEDAMWEGPIPLAVAKKWSRSGSAGRPSVSSRLGRLAGPPFAIPVVYVDPDLALRLTNHDGPGSFAFRIRRGSFQTSNLVAVLGDKRKPGVLLSAHWDGVGVGDAASDNAAGVATVLSVAARAARVLREKGDGLPLVIALFGAEEFGLHGSRQFAAIVSSDVSPLAKPLLHLNVDGIGNSGSDTVYLIGRSKYPQLLKPFQAAIEQSKLSLGRDIDKFAYPLGSDHWPLHQIGVPAVSVFAADYRAMNTSADALGKIDIPTWRRITQVVARTVRHLRNP